MSEGSLPEELLSKEPLVEALNWERNALYAVLRGLGEEDLRQHGAVDQYTVAGLCGLISAWENRLLTLLQQISLGDVERIRARDLLQMGSLPFTDAAFNETQIRKRSRWSWREILGEMVLTREETGWTLANMPEPVLFAPQPVQVPEGGIVHYSPADIVYQIMLHDHHCTQKIAEWRLHQDKV
jgi:hypothetical protein